MSETELAISYRTRRALAEPGGETPFGAQHYSYAAVKRRFCDCLARHRHPFREIDRPEIYPVPRSRLNDVVHLQFKPFEEIRLLRGAPNVAHVAWEFERLPTGADFRLGDPRHETPLQDARHMLGLVDEIWVGSQFTRKTLAAAGLGACVVAPAPIPTPSRPRGRWAGARDAADDAARLTTIEASPLTRHTLRAWREAGRSPQARPLAEAIASYERVALLVASVGDRRKNLPAAALGFTQGARGARACLVLKLVVEPGAFHALQMAYAQLWMRFAELELSLDDQECPDVFLVPDRLDEAQMRALTGCAHFYLCSAFAEGQNLPLLEAMAQGAAPISVDHTAMADYIDAGDAFVIGRRRARAPMAFAAAYGLEGLEIDACGVEDVADAVGAALAASAAEARDKAQAAYLNVRKSYAPEAVYRIVAGRLARLRGA